MMSKKGSEDMRRERRLIRIGDEDKTQVTGKLRQQYEAVDKSMLSRSSSSVCGPVSF